MSRRPDRAETVRRRSRIEAMPLWTHRGHARSAMCVDALLRIYVKCLVGQDELAKRRITEALRDDDHDGEDHDGGSRRPRLTWARIRHSQPHTDASGRTQPHSPSKHEAPLTSA